MSTQTPTPLEDHILVLRCVVLCQESFIGCSIPITCTSASLSCDLRARSCLISTRTGPSQRVGCLSLFVLALNLKNLLQSEDVLTLQLVQLRLNVCDRALDARNDHVVQRIHSTVGDLDGLVECHERCLQRGQLDQASQGAAPQFLGARDLLATSSQADRLAILHLHLCLFEHGQLDTSHIVRGHGHSQSRRLRVVDHRSAEIAGRINRIREREQGVRELLSDATLRLVDVAQKSPEPHSQRICLLLEQLISLLGADAPALE
mmetsp:Transcript_8963/g.28305  ORF Transcript_8963/g.28305 Transcript_8963/m.28305 type:complete len:262 (-) Transcript_8963:57-842(-)